MKYLKYDNYEQLSKAAANMVKDHIRKKPNTVLGLATGSTPIGLYKELIEMNNRKEVDFSQVTTFNLDEYYRIPGDNPQSYRYYMFENLFKHINIDPKNIHIPNGNAEKVEDECRSYDGLINDAGGIDLQILGIGSNGHIGFNEPSDELTTVTHLTQLTESTIKDNMRFFNSIDEVPTHAITMGMGSILKARKIVLLVSGKNKNEVIKKLFEQRISTNVPASLLQIHPDTIVLMEEEML